MFSFACVRNPTAATQAIEEEENCGARRDPYHRLEFDTTMHFFKEYSPKRGLVLDAGGGPGRYTLELAKLGYDVVLLDLTPELLDIARNQFKKAKVTDRVKQVLQSSIDDLSMFGDNTFDAVVCLGALSHVTDKEDRERTIDELVRPPFLRTIANHIRSLSASNSLYHFSVSARLIGATSPVSLLSSASFDHFSM